MAFRNENKRIRILICDDHPMMLFGIKDFLSTQKSVEIIGTAGDGEEAIVKVRELRPDIVLMDIGLPGDINGLEATCRIRREFADIKVIILTMHDDEEYIRQFVKSGADGYVLKKSPPEELSNAITSVCNGHAFFSPAVSSALLKDKQESSKSSGNELTEREQEVLKFIAKGLTSREIADKLFISVRTVGTFRESLMQKLNLHSIADLTRYAISKRIVS